MDLGQWISIIAGVIQAVVAVLLFFGITASSMKIPTSTAALIAFLMVLTWMGVAVSYYLRSGDPFLPSPVPTEIRLQFRDRDSSPLAIDNKNIWRWYTLQTVVKGIDAKTGALNEVGRNVTVFLIFDKPVKLTQFRIDGMGSTLPMYEVKDSSPRGAVIVFSGELTGKVVEIQVLSS